MKFMTSIICLTLFCLAQSWSAEQSKTNATTEKKQTSLMKAYVEKEILTKGNPKDWAAKVGDAVITKSELDEAYNLITAQMPMYERLELDEKNMKKQLLSQMILETVVIQDALKNGYFDSPKTTAMFKYSLRQALYKMYATQAVTSDDTKIKPTDAEVESYYKQNAERYSKAGLSASQIKEAIAQELVQQKAQLMIGDYLEKTKEKYKVERNDALLKEAGLD